MTEEKREFEERGRRERWQRRRRIETASIYVGEVKDGERHGRGTLTLPDGEKYEGEFKDGKYDGRGTLTLPDGEKYEGEFKDGKYDGRGTLTLPDGEKYEGEYKDGKPWTVTFTDVDGSKTEWKDGYEIDDELDG